MIKNIFYKSYTYTWQNVLTIAHLIFIITFSTGLMLIKLYNNSFAKGLFVVSVSLAVVYTILKVFAERKKKHCSEKST